MANVILFTANAPRQMFFEDKVFCFEHTTYPAGAYAIASHLRQRGYSVLVIPYCLQLSFKGVQKIINDHQKDLLWVGVSTTLMSIRASSTQLYREHWHSIDNDIVDTQLLFDDTYSRLNKANEVVWGSQELNAIANYIQHNYDIPLIIGGAWLSYIANGNFQQLQKNIHLVSGNAEKYAEELTQTLAFGKKNDLPLFVDNNHYDNTDFFQSKYTWTNSDLLESNDWVPLEISRGCAFNCAYCTYDKKSTPDAFKNPDVIRNELIELYEKYGITKYILMDDLYNDSKNKVRQMYDRVWSRLPFKPEWTSYLRLDMIWSDPDSAKIIQESGCRIGSFGIETMHDKAGKKVGKGLGKKRIIETLEFLKRTWKDDVLVATFFIMGLPEEPEESMLQTAEWLKTTDLVYSYKMEPLWITPPEHKSFVLKINPMSNDYDKYGITWTENEGWKNSLGITYKRANEISEMCVKNAPMINLQFSNYPEFRTMGLSHDEIVALKYNHRKFGEVMSNGCQTLQHKINHRVKKFLEITDIATHSSD